MADGVLNGKTIIVTGAGSPIGMGREMSISLASAGANVVMMDIDGATLEASASDAREASSDEQILSVVADVTSYADAQRVVQSALDHFGGLHVLVNNAGTNQRNVGMSNTLMEPWWDVTPEAWARVIAVNFSGPFHMARAAVGHMLEQGWGRIIGVTTSLDTMIRINMSPYGPSKAGHEALVATMATELEGTGVTANVLVPGGPVNTNLLPPDSPFDRAKLIQPDVMRVPVVWLASDAADGVNGRRFIAYDWDESLPIEERLEKAGAPAAWPQIPSKAVYPA
ncbi:MAG: SDR family NAD(P)-dependent oxidoreductase [Chloroflexi bacterium]|nr:SDR family NAD(P)-dependent oxidoreductase [Chloroflexota bacterium]